MLIPNINGSITSIDGFCSFYMESHVKSTVFANMQATRMVRRVMTGHFI